MSLALLQTWMCNVYVKFVVLTSVASICYYVMSIYLILYILSVIVFSLKWVNKTE